ncbi:hypothetical protein DEA8626_00977 [Defluviimonas aquaemixtae]|uniref:Sulfotransferase domain-containing protein n=1 Tax=Albidovulum aquaemixtae TaxID=1542388 RepID=A0A2R8B4C8_9RHOB|nr:hypothetical protein [Defluviimonas aquaemixtae]SPH17455.1 hypothetical protein DEA8626_00977 [Defluviimonas aquaemixtae]
MQIVYHLGAHCTDEDRLVRALMKNRGTLAAAGISVPSPRRYRQLLPRIAKSLAGGPAAPDTQSVILDAVMEADEAERLIFSYDGLLCFPVNVVSERGFYATAPKRTAAYANLFPEARSEFFLALRNPATLIPDLIRRTKDGTYDALMSDTHPLSLRWSHVIRRMLAHVPEIDLTVWCNEDTPLIWPEVLRAVAGLGPEEALEGDFDLLAAIMTEDGLAKLKAYLDGHPPETVEERRRITTEFLAAHARPEELEVEIELPGWTIATVGDVTAAYEADCAEIAEMPGVTFIAP